MSGGHHSARAWLGLGGNIGDPIRTMGEALRLLEARGDTRIVAVSPVYRTPPWGKTDQNWFYNACAVIDTDLPPLVLMQTCLDVERALKRVRIERWGPRTVDIDILAMSDPAGHPVILNEDRLTLPHPRMMERAFVLVPLNDIAPTLVINGQNIAEAMAHCQRDGIEKARTDAGWWKESN